MFPRRFYPAGPVGSVVAGGGQDMTCRVILQVRQRTWSNIIIRSAGHHAPSTVRTSYSDASHYSTHQQGSASCDTDCRRGLVRLCGWAMVTEIAIKRRDVRFDMPKPSDVKT